MNLGIKFVMILAGLAVPVTIYAAPAKNSKPAAVQSVKTKGKVRVYKGESGVTAEIVELSEPANGALVKVDGTNSDLDEAVLLHQRKEHDGGRRFSYDTRVKGEGFSTVYSENGLWGDQLLLQNPEYVTKKINLWYDAKASKDVKPESLVKAYTEQAKSGKHAKIQNK
jgi:hypothetical protein